MCLGPMCLVPMCLGLSAAQAPGRSGRRGGRGRWAAALPRAPRACGPPWPRPPTRSVRRGQRFSWRFIPSPYGGSSRLPRGHLLLSLMPKTKEQPFQRHLRLRPWTSRSALPGLVPLSPDTDAAVQGGAVPASRDSHVPAWGAGGAGAQGSRRRAHSRPPEAGPLDSLGRREEEPQGSGWPALRPGPGVPGCPVSCVTLRHWPWAPTRRT